MTLGNIKAKLFHHTTTENIRLTHNDGSISKPQNSDSTFVDIHHDLMVTNNFALLHTCIYLCERWSFEDEITFLFHRINVFYLSSAGNFGSMCVCMIPAWPTLELQNPSRGVYVLVLRKTRQLLDLEALKLGPSYRRVTVLWPSFYNLLNRKKKKWYGNTPIGKFRASKSLDRNFLKTEKAPIDGFQVSKTVFILGQTMKTGQFDKTNWNSTGKSKKWTYENISDRIRSNP